MLCACRTLRFVDKVHGSELLEMEGGRVVRLVSLLCLRVFLLTQLFFWSSSQQEKAQQELMQRANDIKFDFTFS